MSSIKEGRAQSRGTTPNVFPTPSHHLAITSSKGRKARPQWALILRSKTCQKKVFLHCVL
jgi:hypothetical protein